MLYPHKMLTELEMHLPPLEIQLETLTVKFLCKLLTSTDEMTGILIQIDGSLRKEFQCQLQTIKRYILWRNPLVDIRKLHQIDLCNMEIKWTNQYDKALILQYQQSIWMQRMKIATIHMGTDTVANDKLIGLIRYRKIISY